MKKSFDVLPWVHNANVYEVNLRQYTDEGTFNAFALHLPRLADMGIKVLWFMPITPIAQEQRQGSLGSYYAASAFDTTNPEYGTIDDFKNLVQAAHQLNMKVIIDWVTNHTGYGHTWMTSNPEYYLKSADGKFVENNGWIDVADLNYQSMDMRQAMIDAMKFWVNHCDIDGYRCDMAHLVPLQFWIDARTQLDAIKPLFWLAECEEPAYHQAFDASYAWEWMHASETFSKSNQAVITLDKVLYRYQDLYPSTALKLFFTANHDENSWNGTEYEKYSDFAKLFSVFSFTWNGLPLVYSGQEIPNKKRLAFFDKDVLTWPVQPALHAFYKTLATLRTNNPALLAAHKNSFTYRLNVSSERCLAYLRKNDKHEVLVILNFTNQEQELRMNDHRLHGKFKDVFNSIEQDFVADRKVVLPAAGFYLMEKIDG